jgi:hypothetical protein
VAGISNYGYFGKIGGKKFNTLTNAEIKKKFDTGSAKRDDKSGELVGEQNGEIFVFCDSICLDQKAEAVRQTGINKISVWHLGGGDWFS